MTTDLTESKNLTALKDKLREMFQLDQADLDFGIYRIMNAKRDEVERFLDSDLLPQVRDALAKYQPAELVDLRKEWGEIQKAPNKFAPEYISEIEEKLKSGVDVDKLEEEIYSHLTAFFSRYYHGGDFMSLRRYKEGVYVLPYEGEEVKLHWANADQYYIKSSESFQSYAFKLPQTFPAEPGAAGAIIPRRVRFDLASAGTERDNVKALSGKERRFILDQDQPLCMDGDELVLRFHYQPDADKRKQKDLNTLAVETILALADDASALVKITEWDFWKNALATKAPTAKNATRTVLEKHLNDYTAKNSFDYFIHKDLGRFFRRELDFFIKNEVLFLDDMLPTTSDDLAMQAALTQQQLSKAAVLASIAHKFIDFLAQLEDFQKKLWLKKKFVLETNWLVTLDKVPEDLYPTIIANDAQQTEWVKLFAIDEIKGDLAGGMDYSEPLSIEFLKANPFLVLDTIFFDEVFKDVLLASFEDIDEDIGGLLVHGENFQAINLLKDRYREQVKCIYIDPPYNTNASEIAYKNGYKHSSWISLMNDRLKSSLTMLGNNGQFCIAIDDFEYHRLYQTICDIIGEDLILGTAVVRSNPAGRSTARGFSIAHEYLIFGSPNSEAEIGRLPRNKKQLERYKESDVVGPFEWVNFRKHGGENANRFARPKLYYPIYVSENSIRIPMIKWNTLKNAWDILEQPAEIEEVVLPINNDGEEKTWKWGHETAKNKIDDLMAKPDQTGGMGLYSKSRMNMDGALPLTLWERKEYSATEYGTNFLSKIIGDSNLFSFPKSIHAVEDSLRVMKFEKNDTVIDFFAGSGTTAHATINLNRLDNGNRKFIVCEMGAYFDVVTKPRITKCHYSSHWKDGKPISRDGLSHLSKYIRLESYEDCLDNLTLSRTPDQQKLVDEHDEFREDYMLGYMLDVESKGSLLDLKAFADPFSYKLSVVRDDERKSVNVDLVETFNYLLGLRVKTRERVRDVLEITGENAEGEKILILWRNVANKDNDALDKWFDMREYNSRDMEFDLIYVNGDNNIENLRRTDETWKVRLTEEAFHTLMFDVEDV